MRLILSLFAVSAVVLLSMDASANEEKSTCPMSCLTKQASEQQQCELLTGEDRTDCVQRAGQRYRNCTTTCKPQSAAPRTQPAAHVTPLLTTRD